MTIASINAELPPDGADDIEYVRGAFVPLDDAARPLVERGVLPRATYVLPDGTAMVPEDHAALLDETGGDAGAVATLFRERFVAAGGDQAAADEELAAWLSGEYGACLHSTTPEAIVVKDALITAIRALLARPRPDDGHWRGALRGAVDALDALERPFARFDRERFGGPCSRDRYVAAVREQYADLWA